MAEKRYTVVEWEGYYVIHKVGCGRIKDQVEKEGGTKRTAKLDLEVSDEELLSDLDAYLEDTIDNVEICDCTGYEMADALGYPVGGGPEGYAEPVAPQGEDEEYSDEYDEDDVEEEDATPATPAALASQQAARVRLQKQVEEAIDKLVIARGVDNVGEDDQWSDRRLESCTDDFVYDLAVEVRKMREQGEPWWRVAHELGLPGSGATNKQGRKGSAFARRLWRAAWGKTYLGTTGKRESKAAREERAARNAGRPYFSEEATETEIIGKITGKLLHWVARLPVPDGLVYSSQEAYVHDDPRLVRYRLGPQGPYVEFYEQVDPAQLLVDPRLSIAKSGPLRAVYVDRITRVGV